MRPLWFGAAADFESMRRERNRHLRRMGFPEDEPSARNLRWMAEDQWLTKQWELTGLPILALIEGWADDRCEIWREMERP